MITIVHYMILSAVLFSLGFVGIVLNRKNIIHILICIELMLLAVNTNFLAFAHLYNDVAGEIFVFFVLTVAAAEAAIGLAIVVLLYRNIGTINVDQISHLKG